MVYDVWLYDLTNSHFSIFRFDFFRFSYRYRYLTFIMPLPLIGRGIKRYY